MKTLWLVVGIALVLLVVYLLGVGRREKFGDAGSPGLPTTAPTGGTGTPSAPPDEGGNFGTEIPASEGIGAGPEEKSTAGGVGDRQPINCASGETRATATGADFTCIPVGTDIFDIPPDRVEAKQRGEGPSFQDDPAIFAKWACKKDGYRLLRIVGDDLTKPPSQPKCVANAPAPDMGTGVSSPPAPNGGGSGSPFTSGNTTGGSSSTSAGPNSGGGGNRRKQIFGPLFTEIGDGGNFSKGEDSSKTNQYPELLGGGEVRKSTLVPGVGVVDPSKNSDTTGLPTPAGLGSNEDSKFLPTSRVPGDMEKIPDPWRVSQSFSASNYSFKTDPVPFLTNFSAFQK